MANTLNLGNGQWATKEGSLLAYNSENNNYKPLPFTFDRASSATRVNKDGLIEAVGSDMPRIDYKDDSEGALLLEPQRSNLIQYSNIEDGWDLLSGSSIAYNQAVSPEGIQNASILSGDGINFNSIYDAIDLSLQSYTLSVFAKQKGVSVISFEGFTSGALGLSKFNLSNGTIATNSSNQFSDEKIEDYGNGWYRCSVKLTPTSSGIKFFGFRGESSDSGELFSLYGAQLEEGSYATSYIPTQGSAVTRLADSCYQGGLLDKGVLNNTALTLFFNSTLTSDTTNQFLDIISMHHSTASKEIRIESRTNNILYIQQGGVVNSGDNFNSLNLGSNSINFKKIAIVLTTTQFKVFADGSQIGSTLNGSYNVNFDSLGFQTFNGAVQTKIQNKEIKLYNTALSDSELQALTQV